MKASADHSAAGKLLYSVPARQSVWHLFDFWVALFSVGLILFFDKSPHFSG